VKVRTQLCNAKAETKQNVIIIIIIIIEIVVEPFATIQQEQQRSTKVNKTKKGDMC